MKTMHVYISGFVQGVGYRRFIKSKAGKLGLSGYVRNLSDNRVEAVFQGDIREIKTMLKICKDGPFLAEVKNIEVSPEESETVYGGFDIIL